MIFMEFRYKPSGVCSREFIINIDKENNVIEDVKILGGCAGNTQGIVSLIKGMNVDYVIEKLRGIRCGNKNTSCPDQLANALEDIKSKK